MTRENSIRRHARKGANVSHQILVIIITFALGYFTASIFNIEALSNWIGHHAGKEIKPVETAEEVHSAPKEKSSAKPKFEFYTLLANEKGVGEQAAQALKSNDTEKTRQANENPAQKVALKESNVMQSAAEQTSTVTLKQLEPVKLNDNRQQESKPVVAIAPRQEKSQIINQPLPSPKPPQPQQARGRFMVQVASFKTRNDAEHMKGKLTLKGFEVNVVSISTPQKGIWHRVVVGPYPNRVLAQKAQTILLSSERLHGMVVVG